MTLDIARSRRPLFLQQRFWPMWTALSLGAFTDNMLRQALLIGIPFGAIKISGLPNADDAIPIIGLFFPLAMLMFSTISGQIAEKYETASLFRRTKLAEVVLMAIAAIGFYLNSGLLLIITLFAMGAQSAFFSPARLAAMPKYLRPNELVRGNGLCNAGLYVSILVGLFLGGLLIAAPNGGAKISVILLVASLAGWLAIRNAPHGAPNSPDLRFDWNPFQQGARIFSYAFRAPGVVRPVLGAAFFFYTSTLVTLLIPLYVKSTLQADELTATMIMGLFAIGAGVGALAAASLTRRRSGLGFSTFGIAGAAALTLLIFVLTQFARNAPGGGTLTASAAGIALAIAFCLTSALMGIFIAPLQAAMQRRAPPAERARILAASNMANAAAAIFGSLSILAVTQGGLPPDRAFLIVAALQSAVAAYMVWRKRRVPEGLHDDTLLAPPHGENA